MTLGKYLVASALVWAAVLLATSWVLWDTPLLLRLLPVLGGGTAWFFGIGPWQLRRKQKP